jgi:hypothetical protein
MLLSFFQILATISSALFGQTGIHMAHPVHFTGSISGLPGSISMLVHMFAGRRSGPRVMAFSGQAVIQP